MAAYPARRSVDLRYFHVAWVVYLGVTLVAVLDRLGWNVNPRQSYALVHGWRGCQQLEPFGNDTKIVSTCGGDYFCGDAAAFDEYKGEMPKAVGSPWCLKEGPWSVQAFDFLSRCSGRIIITTTSLMFLTMCHCSWNSLAGAPRLRGFLRGVKEDNIRLHRWGGTLLGVCVIVHVWSLFLPSIVDGFTNRFVVGDGLSWPAQVSLGTSQIDSQAKVANWGIDDLWRLVWMTLMFLVFFPLSRATRALAANYSLMMWLHVAVGMGFFFDSWRRRTHPHVWLFNTPFVLWYVLDRLAGRVWYRQRRSVVATRFKLDDDYMVLMWRTPPALRALRSVCDLYWSKASRHTALGRRLEWRHPFTTATTHRLKSGEDTIAPPMRSSDLEWTGHKFGLAQRTSSGRSVHRAASSDKMARGASARFVGAEDAPVVRGPELGAPKPARTSILTRHATTQFHLARERSGAVPSDDAFDQVQVIRVHGARGVRDSETGRWARQPGVTTEIDVQGPFRGKYSALFDALMVGPPESRPPLLVVATGAGAGLVLDVVSTMRFAADAANHPPSTSAKPVVEIIYSTFSVPLLQYVTDALLDEPIDELVVSAVLTRLEGDVCVIDASPSHKGGIQFERVDFASTVASIVDDATVVYFCGGAAVSTILAAACKQRGVAYVGSSVE